MRNTTLSTSLRGQTIKINTFANMRWWVARAPFNLRAVSHLFTVLAFLLLKISLTTLFKRKSKAKGFFWSLSLFLSLALFVSLSIVLCSLSLSLSSLAHQPWPLARTPIPALASPSPLPIRSPKVLPHSLRFCAVGIQISAFPPKP